MLTARFIGEGRITLEEKVKPVPGPGEVLVKVAYCGLCGSEKPQYLGGYVHHQGHELSGEVVETGTGTKLAVGTKVVGYLTKYCGTCSPCSAGYTTACALYKQKENLGWSWPGGFAEYVILPERNALPIGPEIDLENAVLLLDTLGTPFHGLRVIQAEGAQTACVIGCGTVGLGTILILKALGVNKVVASDFSAYRLEAAESLGAIPVKAGEVDLQRFIEKELDPAGVDLVVEAVGLPQTFLQGLHLTKPGGKFLALGELPDEFTMKIDLPLRLKDQILARTWYFPVSEFYLNLKLWQEGFFARAPELISHIYPLSDMQEACSLFYNGQTLKVLIKP